MTDAEKDESTCNCSEHVKPGEYYYCPKCDADWFPEDEDDEEDAR